MNNKKVTLSADGATATVAPAEFLDIVTTTFSSDSAVTGMYGLGQKAALVLLGMGIQNNRLGRGWNPFGVAA